jgi:hypothetical protein
MEEVIAPKGVQKPRRTLLEFRREGHDEYFLHNAEPTSPKLLATTVTSLELACFQNVEFLKT